MISGFIIDTQTISFYYFISLYKFNKHLHKKEIQNRYGEGYTEEKNVKFPIGLMFSLPMKIIIKGIKTQYTQGKRITTTKIKTIRNTLDCIG